MYYMFEERVPCKIIWNFVTLYDILFQNVDFVRFYLSKMLIAIHFIFLKC